MTTFATILAGLQRADPGRPLVTFYDHASGERTELSVTTYANWVAKTASLLAEEHDLERGQSLRLDLPCHWLGPVFLGAAWTVGLTVVWDEAADAFVCGPGGVDRWAPYADDAVVLASALHPLGRPFDAPLPAGVHDVGATVWSQPDAFAPLDPPGPDDAAVGTETHAAVWEAAAAGSLLADGGRLYSEANPASPSGLSSFTEPLVRGGSVVLVAHPDPDRVGATYASERATSRA
ncbi:TIGR03089 family protein [Nocardioides coralli]|uniref:TIGR03089 family protein n=1 Tax=Nocardioides coralli TaxID=2872154 RepID=UPI001CA43E43|nr:TIGR03089 family protein [Nocardioides coralli]QZY30012.1 TIGR03089 family protein [Nocardioides coralli]